MEPLTPPNGLSPYLEFVTDGLLTDKVQLWELPRTVSELYYLGEASARRSLQPQLLQAQCDRDRYYLAASRGGFTSPLKPQGLTFAELCRERGEYALANKVDADMASLAFQVRGNA